jgi:putative DNA primase/helicase
MSAQQDVASAAKQPALEELQSRPQWVCWRKEQRRGKLTKVPYNPRTGARAHVNEPQTWGTYRQAKAAWDKHPSRYDGIGYMFSRDYTGIDLDHCLDPDGTISAWAQHWIDRLASYAEYSPGSGIHVLVRGTILHGLRRRMPGAPHSEAAIELYCERRYFTITGRHVEGTPFTIEDRSGELEALFAEVCALSEQHRRERASQEESTEGDGGFTDGALIDKALAARNGTTFRALWQGDSSGYLSPSEADQALCNLLAFWTGRDAQRMDRLFRRSALYRPEKWDRPARAGETYGQGTIARAIAACHEVYTPHATLQARPPGDKIIPFPSRRAQATPGMEQLGELPETELTFVLDCLSREEEGDAQLYAHLFRDKCLYDHTEGTWYEWRGHYWECDECKHALLLASGPLAAVYLEASATLSEQAAQEARRIDPDLHDEDTDHLRERYAQLKAQTAALIERARGLRKLRRAQAVLTYAQALLTITAGEWDTNPWLLGTREGVLDLQTGTLRPGRQVDHIRTVIPTTWRGLEEGAQRFERFLREIFADRPDVEREELIAFLQRALGYGITGHTSEHIFLMLYGEEGRNGKDTLMTILHAVLGPAAGAVSNDVIIATGKLTAPGSAKPHLCSLQGKRLAWASETDRKPHADARDAAFWDRLCLITFNLRFVDAPSLPSECRRDPTLSRALEAEASGILAWLVRGCLSWQQSGLQLPASVRKARQEYREEEDTLGQFLEECCVFGEHESVRAGLLYERYKAWAAENTLKAMNGNAFGLEMRKRFRRDREKAGYTYYGIGLLAPDELVYPPESRLNPSGPASAAHAARKISSSGVPGVPTCRETPYERGANVQTESFRKVGTPGTPSSTIRGQLSQPMEPSEQPSNGAKSGYTNRSLVTAAEEAEAKRLLAQLQRQFADMPRLFWHIPGSGFEKRYLPRDEYFRRLEICLASDDPGLRKAVLDDMKAIVRGAS